MLLKIHNAIFFGQNGSGVPVFKLEVGSTYQIRIGFKPKEFPKVGLSGLQCDCENITIV